MSFEELPNELKCVISDFAWECKWKDVQKDLNTCDEIKSLKISSVFLRQQMWSLKYKRYIPNPLTTFEPICNYTGEWFDFIDWCSVQEMLWRLDFRRKIVRIVQTRDGWRKILMKNWRNIKVLDEFYKFLLYTQVNCFKPSCKPVRFNCLQSYMSPYMCARWWLQGEIN